VASLWARELAYPEICSRHYFKGAALNVMTVAERAFRPSELNILAGHEHDKLDDISALLDLVTVDRLSELDNDLAWGPGGTQANPIWNTRNSFSQGARQAVNWATASFEDSGAATQQMTFNSTYCNNIIAQFTGVTNPDEIVILGAHMDSRNEIRDNTANPAPGADDNGSGSSAALLLAKLIQQTGINKNFQRTLQIQTYCGEEQGLVGSGAIARGFKQTGVNVVAMFNIDMVGYRRPIPNSNPPIPGYISLAFMTGSTTKSLTDSCKSITTQYVVLGPETQTYIGDTGACCSDQQSFFSQPYPAVSLFETNTSGAVYPDYHRQTDTPDKVNFEQVSQFAKAVYACALTAVLTL